MAKQKNNDNQMDLFKSEVISAEVDSPKIEDKVETLSVVSEQPSVVKAEEVVVSKVEETVVEPTNSVQAFLKEKEAEVSSVTMVEIVGQVKMSEHDFIQSVPEENRFVSLSMHSDDIIITPIPEDGSIKLKDMKDKYPNFVTQIQKADDLADQFTNMEFLEKVKDLVAGKKKAGKTLDDKEIKAEVSFINKLENGDITVDEDESPQVEEKVVPKVAKPKM